MKKDSRPKQSETKWDKSSQFLREAANIGGRLFSLASIPYAIASAINPYIGIPIVANSPFLPAMAVAAAYTFRAVKNCEYKQALTSTSDICVKYIGFVDKLFGFPQSKSKTKDKNDVIKPLIKDFAFHVCVRVASTMIVGIAALPVCTAYELTKSLVKTIDYDALHFFSGTASVAGNLRQSISAAFSKKSSHSSENNIQAPAKKPDITLASAPQQELTG